MSHWPARKLRCLETRKRSRRQDRARPIRKLMSALERVDEFRGARSAGCRRPLAYYEQVFQRATLKDGS